MSDKFFGLFRNPKALLAIGLVAVLVGIYLLSKRENPHYLDGLSHLSSRNYEDAESQFRICVDEVPDHPRAKGLLAYSQLRQNLETQKPDSARAILYDQFAYYYVMNSWRKAQDLVQDRELRDDLIARIKQSEKDVREVFRTNRIYFRDWDDVFKSIGLAAEVIFNLPHNSENIVDEAIRDCMAAILVRDGHKSASDYLIRRLAIEPDARLALLAGEQFAEQLTSESERKDSFVAAENGANLRMLMLIRQLRDFVKAFPDIRCMRRDDLASDQVDLIPNRTLSFLFDEPDYMLTKLEAFSNIGQDPSAVAVTSSPIGNGDHLVLLSGWSSTQGQFICRPIVWSKGEYHIVKITGSANRIYPEFTNKNPIGLNLQYDSKTDSIQIATRKVQEVVRERVVSGTRAVRRYRTEQRWNGHLYGRFLGGYELVQIPYVEDEPYSRTVNYLTPATGNVWRTFNLNHSNWQLTESSSRWESDFDGDSKVHDIAVTDQAEIAPQSNEKLVARNDVNITATSTAEANATKYGPSLAMDTKLSTAWNAGNRRNFGVGESLMLKFVDGKEHTISSLEIVPGYAKVANDKYGSRWTYNHRIKWATIFLSDGSTIRAEFDPNEMNFQSVAAVVGRQTSFVKIRIDDIVPGTSTSADTAISEVRIIVRN